MGGGNDTVNVVGVIPVTELSTLTTLVMPNLTNFAGTLNAGFTGTTGTNPAVRTATQVATLDPTAFGQTDRTLMDFSGGGVHSRFDWVSQFFDFTLQGGGTNNKSTRSVMSNLAASGFDSAEAIRRPAQRRA